ncbi:hypothetical protein EJ609_15585, partial [Pseudomonas aeruginosa]
MRQASGSSRGTGSIRTPFRWRKKSKRVLVEIDGGDDCRAKARCRAFDKVTQAGGGAPPPRCPGGVAPPPAPRGGLAPRGNRAPRGRQHARGAPL